MKERWFKFWCFFGMHTGCVLHPEQLHATAIVDGMGGGWGRVTWGGTCYRTGRYLIWERDDV